MEDIKLITIGLLILGSNIFTAVFKKTKIPDVLPLTLIGLLLGPITGVLHAEEFGFAGEILGPIALILMLFDGGSHFQINTLKSTLVKSYKLLFGTFFLTTFSTFLFSLFFLNYDFLPSLFIGLILGNISPAIVVPLIKLISIPNKIKNILFIESAVSDVISIILSLSILNIIKIGSVDFGKIIGLEVFGSIILAIIFGTIGAMIWSTILSRIRKFPNTMFSSLAFLFILFGLSDFFSFNGPITALTFGMILANSKKLPKELATKLGALNFEEFNDIERTLFSEVIFLVKTFFFIFLGISIQLNNLKLIFLGFILTTIILFGRLLITKITVKRFSTKFERGIISSIIPKGLATAVLADIPIQMFEGQNTQMWLDIRSLVYSVILFSIIFTSILIYLQENHIIDEKVEKYL